MQIIWTTNIVVRQTEKKFPYTKKDGQNAVGKTR